MKKPTLRLTALALAALMLLSSLWIVVSAAPASYSTASNSGKRGEVCVSLDGTGVSSYYTGRWRAAQWIVYHVFPNREGVFFYGICNSVPSGIHTDTTWLKSMGLSVCRFWIPEPALSL